MSDSYDKCSTDDYEYYTYMSCFLVLRWTQTTVAKILHSFYVNQKSECCNMSSSINEEAAQDRSFAQTSLGGISFNTAKEGSVEKRLIEMLVFRHTRRYGQCAVGKICRGREE